MEKKKLYYLPGIISMIGLPILLFIWGPPDPVREKCFAMHLPGADEAETTRQFTTPSFSKAIKNKKIIPLDLNDFTWNEQSQYLHKQKFSFIQHTIEKLQFTNDTAAVFKISFGSQNSYRHVVWVLNQLIIYDVKNYALIDDAIYLFPNPPARPQYASFVLPPDSYMITVPHQTTWQNIQLSWQQNWRKLQRQVGYFFYKQEQNKWLAAGFLLLIAIPAIVTTRKLLMHRPVSYSLS